MNTIYVDICSVVQTTSPSDHNCFYYVVWSIFLDPPPSVAGPETLTELCRKHGVERPMDTCPGRLSVNVLDMQNVSQKISTISSIPRLTEKTYSSAKNRVNLHGDFS